MKHHFLIPLRVMARRMAVPAAWLRAEAEAGRVPHLRAGNHFLFHPTTVRRLLAERARAAHPTNYVEEGGNDGR